MGIVARNGAAIDEELLRALTDFLSYRGPDATAVWRDNHAGFGHTMLRTTRESLSDRQPASLDGNYWITADVRLDCRAELEAALRRAGRNVRRGTPDSELILHAYAAWEDECVDHLRGDFAFAVWDARKKQLFCARDHFGIKPFYYAEAGGLFLFSNTLKCLRLHPEISDELNEAAIGDFLLFGLNHDAATTTFRDIKRLPAAHSLIVSVEGLRIRRYWSPPTDGRIRYRRAEDYVENFRSLFQEAVADRMGAGRTGISLSGGLDSASVAAAAREISGNSAGGADLRAYTIVYENMLPADEEGAYARETAEFLGIPIQFLALDGLQPFERWGDAERIWPEPPDDPFAAGSFDEFGTIARDCRVALSGEGSDNLMHFQMLPYARNLARNGEWERFFAEMARYLWVRPFPWRGIRQRTRRLLGRDSTEPVFPCWIAPDFARRVNLERRWKECRGLPGPLCHPLMPKAHASLALPHWTHTFENEDPGVTHCTVETRYPFLDLRIVNYLLALPPFPWFFQKKLLREAMIGRIPEGVRIRPKTPLQRDPLLAKLRDAETAPLRDARWTDEMERWISYPAMRKANNTRKSGAEDANIRHALCLNFWLRTSRKVRYNLRMEVCNG